ncbi:MAG: methylmalonyl-CoA epimerase [candidate division Zixibacteria bacterium]|nr:methylmalonyl-CoA epimerase [candidate division Zixibacteria bacterium]
MNSVPISHVGIAVKDLDQAIAAYASLLGRSGPDLIEDVPEQKVKVAMFSGAQPEDGGRVELLMGVAEDSPISKFVDRRGEGLHHLCVYVDDIEAKLGDLKAAGVRLIDEVPRIGAGGCRIAFVHPGGSHGVLIELEERRKPV